MAEEKLEQEKGEVLDQEPDQKGEDFVKADPTKNPRYQAMQEIAARRRREIEQESKERFPVTDDDGNVVEEGATATEEESEPDKDKISDKEAAALEKVVKSSEAPTFDPTQEYEVTVDGVKVKVPGSKIINAGIRTFQKEAAADLRLDMASRLLEEAKTRAQQLSLGKDVVEGEKKVGPKEDALDDAALAEAIQFGTKEQATEALRKLRESGRGASPEALLGFVQQNTRRAVADELSFRTAETWAQDEYKDLLTNPYLARLWRAEEDRRRTPKERGGEGDQRSYKELYQSIGEDLRKAFNMPKAKPAVKSEEKTMEQRKEAKSKAAIVPRSASVREEEKGAPKPLTHEEILNKMRRGRHQPTMQ